MSLPRRSFLGIVPALALSPAAALEIEPTGTVHPDFPSQDPALVRETVAASHTDLERVKTLVTASPALAKAAVDWGFGDWESALGAASHMGRRDIAKLLIDHGARPNVFTFAMLGRLDAVKACVSAMAGLQRIPGPHGITLLQHAQQGGEPATEVVSYLESLGDADPRAKSLETSDAQKRIYVGRYAFGSGEDETLEVIINRRGMLGVKRGDRFPRFLHRVEEHGFAPSGSPAVRVRFTVREKRATALTVHDPHPIVTARRQA